MKRDRCDVETVLHAAIENKPNVISLQHRTTCLIWFPAQSRWSSSRKGRPICIAQGTGWICRPGFCDSYIGKGAQHAVASRTASVNQRVESADLDPPDAPSRSQVPMMLVVGSDSTAEQRIRPPSGPAMRSGSVRGQIAASVRFHSRRQSNARGNSVRNRQRV